MARLRVTSSGLVLIDIDIKTLVLNILLQYPQQVNIEYPLSIETVTHGWTEYETIEEYDGEE